MSEKGKMSLVPPKVGSEDKLKAFIEEPETKILQEQKTNDQPISEPVVTSAKKKKAIKETLYPWEEPGVIPEIIKSFSLRIKLPDKLKADYIVANSLEYKSLQIFFMHAVLNQIDRDLKRLGVKE